MIGCHHWRGQLNGMVGPIMKNCCSLQVALEERLSKDGTYWRKSGVFAQQSSWNQQSTQNKPLIRMREFTLPGLTRERS